MIGIIYQFPVLDSVYVNENGAALYTLPHGSL